jgi:hypothetical protein
VRRTRTATAVRSDRGATASDGGDFGQRRWHVALDMGVERHGRSVPLWHGHGAWQCHPGNRRAPRISDFPNSINSEIDHSHGKNSQARRKNLEKIHGGRNSNLEQLLFLRLLPIVHGF